MTVRSPTPRGEEDLAVGYPPEKLTLDDALAAVGVGPPQYLLLAIACVLLACDAMLIVMLRFVAGPAARDLADPSLPLRLPVAAFSGMLVAAPSFGRLADRYGRRPATIAAVATSTVGGLLAVAATSPLWLVGAVFVAGIGVGGVHVGQALLVEFLPPTGRDGFMFVFGTFWTTGVLMETLLALWLCPDPAGLSWRPLALATTAPGAVCAVLLYWRCEESPRYLHLHGRASELTLLLRSLARANGRPGAIPGDVVITALHPTPIAEGGDDAATVGPVAAPAHPVPAAGILALVQSPATRQTTLVLWALWVVCTGLYYAVVLAGPVSGPLEAVAMALVEYPAFGLQYLSAKYCGRRRAIVLWCVLAAAGYAAVALRPTELTRLYLRVSLMTGFNVLWVFTPEAFPTALRSTGSGSCSAVSRLAGAFAPSLVVFLGPATFAGSAAVALLLSAVAATQLPETGGVPLSDSVHAAPSVASP